MWGNLGESMWHGGKSPGCEVRQSWGGKWSARLPYSFLQWELKLMLKNNYYQKPVSEYKSYKTIGRALEEVYDNLIHIDKKEV